jgi:hypothetical protein
MVDLIALRCNECRPITYTELLDTLQYDHETVLSSDTLRHIVRNLPQVKSIVGIPMESERVAVDPEAILAWYGEVAVAIEGVPRRFVFNVDEAGCSENADKREVRVLVPLDYPRPEAEVPFDRHAKRSTLTACIAADGFRMKPFLIISRLTIEAELGIYGYDRANVYIASQENAFMTQRLFEMWGREVFFPTLEERRRQFRYDGRALLLMDGLASHHTPSFMEECGRRGVDVIFLIPHSSDQTQPLDVLTFGLLKQRFAASTFKSLQSKQANLIARILGAWFCASAPHLTVKAFMSVGLIPFLRDGEYFLQVDPKRARRVRSSQGPPEDAPPEPLPVGSQGSVRLPRGLE